MRSLIRKASLRFAVSKYVERVEKVTGVRLPQNRFKDLLSAQLQSQLKDAGESELEEEDLPLVRQPSFDISDAEYQSMFQKDVFGSFEVIEFKGRRLFLSGMNYTNIPAINLWKMLTLAQPDFVLLHLPPDEVLPDFSLNLKNPRTGAFSNRRYFSQLVVQPDQWGLNVSSEPEICELLAKEGVHNLPAAETRSSKTVAQYKSTKKLDQRVPTIAAVFARRNNLPICLSEIPEVVFKQNLVNSLTVSQLRQILNKTTVDSVLNPDIGPCFPINFGPLSHPGLFLRSSDHYTASLLEYIVHKFSCKKIFAFLGSGQCDSVRTLLTKRSPLTLLQTLRTPDPVENIFGEATLNDLVEKMAIYDVIKHGDLVTAKAELKYKSSQAIIEKYSGKNVGDPELNLTLHIYKEMTKKYLRQFKEAKKEGRRNLEDYYTKLIIENPEISN